MLNGEKAMFIRMQLTNSATRHDSLGVGQCCNYVVMLYTLINPSFTK